MWMWLQILAKIMKIFYRKRTFGFLYKVGAKKIGRCNIMPIFYAAQKATLFYSEYLSVCCLLHRFDE